MLKIRTYY